MDKATIIEGAEPLYKHGNEVGILVLHGFTGTTQSVRPLAEVYDKAGYSVAMPCLEGHGTHFEEMEKKTYQDWIASAEEALEWLRKKDCKVLFIIGLSMGGTLALHLAERNRDVTGIALINAAIELPDFEKLEGDDQPRFLDAIHSDIKRQGVSELAYDQVPLVSVQELLKLMNEVRPALDNIHCPALLFVSDEDHVVPPDNSEFIFETVFSEHKELVHLENSYHVATLDHDIDLIVERTLEFFQQYTEVKG
ncbi:alpha/beta hydrolase [Thalassobacillus pellis]|uniref:alpha/beta hydrolase n=1 Tax=Thalassobacillus pellis TaxID=748008 RepID=UPI0019620E47|nr:alpha/beta fold hydrolase [Thalassobacillus pellis]MBM7553031.1 carboxylesterase [Thalassobacillus pellis]